MVNFGWMGSFLRATCPCIDFGWCFTRFIYPPLENIHPFFLGQHVTLRLMSPMDHIAGDARYGIHQIYRSYIYIYICCIVYNSYRSYIWCIQTGDWWAWWGGGPKEGCAEPRLGRGHCDKARWRICGRCERTWSKKYTYCTMYTVYIHTRIYIYIDR